MVPRDKINRILSGYKNFKIATICSHSSLQIFSGARAEGIKTIGIVKKDKKALYESFPLARPDEFIIVDDYSKLPESELAAREAIIIPHGSFVEYSGSNFEKLNVPIYGSRSSVMWERSRDKMFEWLHKAGIKTPRVFKPEEINGPVLVKFPGAKGGQGYVIVKSYDDFKLRVGNRECMIQEFIIGVRAYPHYFFSPFSDIRYKTAHGRLELLGFDS